MAVTQDQLLVNVSVNTEKATQSLEAMTKELGDLRQSLSKTSKSSEETSKSVSSFGASMVKLQAVAGVAKMAFDSLIGPIQNMVAEFTEAQDAQVRLANVLRLTGDNVALTMDDFKEFAETLEATTVVEGDLAIELLKTAKSMGVSNEQAKLMVKTAADLAAVTGDDVQQSFQGLVGTMRGNARGVGELAGLLGDLSKEELKASDGVKRLSEIFDGQAAEAMNTFAGQAARTKNLISQLMETMGEIIASIFNLDESSRSLGDALASLNEWITENKANFIALGKAVISIGDDLINVLVGSLSLVAAAFLKMAQGATFAFEKIVQGLSLIGVVSDETVESVKSIRDSLGEMASDNFSAGIEAFKTFGDTGDTALEQVTTRTQAADRETKKFGGSLKAVNAEFEKLRDEGQKALEELQKKIGDMAAKNRDIGATEAQLIAGRVAVEQKEIDKYEDKLRLAGMLGEANKALIKQARALADDSGEKERGQNQRKHLDELLAKNSELALAVKADGMFQQELIEAQSKALTDQLRAKYRNSDLDAAGVAALEEQIKLIEERAKAEAAKAPSREYQSLVKGGEAAAAAISGVMTSGALSFVGGMASGVGAIIDAIDGMLDLLPNFINKIAGVFDKITNFPKMLDEAVRNLGRSLVSFVSDAIPNLLNTLPDMIDDIVTTLFERLPDAFERLLEGLPAIVDRFMERLPEIAEKFVLGTIVQMPRMAIALTSALVNEAPRIAIAIAKTIAIELPKAIVKGIVDGVRQAAKSIGAFLKGGFKLKLDPRELAKSVSGLARTLSGEASKLFAVMDLGEVTKAQDTAKQLADGIEDGMRRAGDLLRQLWDGLLKALKDAWQWIVDTLLRPLWEFLKALWQWVYDMILKPLLDGLKAVWETVVKPIVDALISGLSMVWEQIVRPILDGFLSAFSALWETLVKPIAEALVSGLSAVFTWVESKVVKPLTSAGAAIADGLKTSLTIDWWKARGKEIWNGLSAAVTAAATTITGWGSSIASGLWNKMIDLDISKLGASMGSGLWNKMIDLDVGKIGASIAVGLWNRIIDFDWSALLPGGGGGGGGSIIPGLARGGLVYAQGGLFVPRGTDTVPAMLTPGEFVVNRGAVQSLGLGAMRSINAGQLPSSGATTNIELNLDIKTTEPIDEQFFRNRLIPRIKDELRRAGLDGQRIVPASGVY